MARTITLTQLLADVRSRGDYEDSDVFSDTLLTKWVNDAIAEVYEFVAQTSEGYYTTSSSLSTVAGTETVALPTTHYSLEGVDILVQGEYVALTRHSLAERNRFQAVNRGTPVSYRLQGSSLVLQPTPDAVYTLRVLFTPHATKLSLGADTFDGINGFEDLVIEKAVLLCDAREEKPLGERLARIEKLEARIKTAAAQRVVSEPQYIGERW